MLPHLRKSRIVGCVPREQRLQYLPNSFEHTSIKTDREVYPDFRAVYANKLKLANKPLLIVLNKYCDEWSLGPINYIPLDALRDIFARFSDQYQIVYLREGQGVIDLESLGHSGDHNTPFEFDDDSLLREHPGVLSFQELVRDRRDLSYNEVKLMLFSDCRHFISSQGGGGYLAALMPGNVMLLMHRCGSEVRHSYVHGHYKYAANPSPTLLVASKTRELLDALPIFDGARSQQDIESDSSLSALLQSLDPKRLHDPDHGAALPKEW
jgi:hypothetical protein